MSSRYNDNEVVQCDECNAMMLESAFASKHAHKPHCRAFASWSDEREAVAGEAPQRCAECGGGGLHSPGCSAVPSKKPRWSLVPWAAMRIAVEVLTHGAGKHDDAGWVDVPVDRHFDALMRHLTAYASDDPIDPESGKPHLAHVVCRALFLLALDGGEDEAES